MSTTSCRCLPSILIALLATASLPSQALPLTWNRSADWVSGLNPCPDSLGNLVWSYNHVKLGISGISSLYQNNAWRYGLGAWVGAAPIWQNEMRHESYQSHYPITPEVRFTNTTTTPFMLAITGTLSVVWAPGNPPTIPNVRVEFKVADASNLGQITTLLSNTSVSLGTFSVNIPGFRLDPGDQVIYRIEAQSTSAHGYVVDLVDSNLHFTRTSSSIACTFGAGCGNPALDLQPLANPTIGTTAQAALSNIPSSLAFVSVGWSNTIAPGPLALPFSLAAYGMPGCNLLQSGEAAAQPVTPTGPGTATYSLPLPNWSTLLGVHLYLQGWAPAPGVNLGGVIVSNGVEWVIGSW